MELHAALSRLLLWEVATGQSSLVLLPEHCTQLVLPTTGPAAQETPDLPASIGCGSYTGNRGLEVGGWEVVTTQRQQLLIQRRLFLLGCIVAARQNEVHGHELKGHSVSIITRLSCKQHLSLIAQQPSTFL